MTDNRWRDDERRWNESRYGRSGSSSGGWGQEGQGRDPYERYESGSSSMQGGAQERRERGEDYGREFSQDEYRQGQGQGQGQRYRGGYDYERGRSGYDYDPYGFGQYGRGSQWRSSQYGQDWRAREGMGANIGRDWRREGSGYRAYEGAYGGAYGSDRDQDRGWWDRTRDEVRSWMGDDDAERRRRMDEMRQRSYYGRGPKGFSRSDERIREDVCERLTYDWSVDASDVEVNVSKGEVTLTGSVESRYSKRRAEDLVDDVPGVRHVQNSLRVKEATESTMGTTGTGTTGTGATGTGATGTGTTARPTH